MNTKILMDDPTDDRVFPVSREQAREALDALDDYAKMSISVDPIGPRKVLERFIAESTAVETVPEKRTIVIDVAESAPYRSNIWPRPNNGG